MRIKDKFKFGSAFLQNRFFPTEKSIYRASQYFVKTNDVNGFDNFLSKVDPQLFHRKEFYYTYFLIMSLKRKNLRLYQKFIETKKNIKIPEKQHFRSYPYDLFLAEQRQSIMQIDTVSEAASSFVYLQKNQLNDFYQDIVSHYTVPKEYLPYEKNYREFITKISPNTKIAVVGNAPSLKEKKLGKFIDSFDIVIRVNNYLVKGFEEFTGKKTSIWMSGNTRRYEDENNLPKMDMQVIITPSSWYFRRHDHHGHISHLFEGNVKKNVPNALILPYAVMMKNECMALMMNPTTGMRAILWALSMTDEPVNIFGFNFFQDTENIYYYGNQNVPLVWKEQHDLDWERKFIDIQVFNNKVIWH
ncbi:MAG: glycosyltransferase family 29 protein [Alphaproteobacteria bacterium]